MLKLVLLLSLAAFCRGTWDFFEDDRADYSKKLLFSDDKYVKNPLVRLNDQLQNLRNLLRDNLLVFSADNHNLQKELFTSLVGGLLLRLRESNVTLDQYLERKGPQVLSAAIRNELDLYDALLSQPIKDVRLTCKPDSNLFDCKLKLDKQRRELLAACPDYQDQLDVYSAFLALGLEPGTEDFLTDLLNKSLKLQFNEQDEFLDELERKYPNVVLALKRLRAQATSASFECLRVFNLGTLKPYSG